MKAPTKADGEVALLCVTVPINNLGFGVHFG